MQIKNDPAEYVWLPTLRLSWGAIAAMWHVRVVARAPIVSELLWPFDYPTG